MICQEGSGACQHPDMYTCIHVYIYVYRRLHRSTYI